MSILYKCEICGYETNMTYNFNRHKNKKVPCKKPIAKPNEMILCEPVKKYIPKKCTHNREKSKCKECGGGSICEHQRIRSHCKECRGGSIYEHNKRKAVVKNVMVLVFKSIIDKEIIVKNVRLI